MNLSSSPPSQVRLAKMRFVEERIAPRGVVNEVVARSWERSQALGLTPHDKQLFNAMASRAEARVIAERHRLLIDAVAPEIERVATALTHSKMLVFCCDAEGLLVHTHCHEPTTPRELRDTLRIGRSLGEAQFGTTAPGCVLAERVPLTVTGEEHFLHEVARFVCAAAPIFQFDGSLAGVVDVTGIDVTLDENMIELVQIAAQASEHRLFASVAPGVHVRLHQDPRFLDTPLRGLLAIDEDGVVLGACSAARRMLRPCTDHRSLQDLFEMDYPSLRRRLHHEGIAELRTRTGARLYASLESTTPLALGDASVLERATSVVVQRTLAEHRGNVSAAARALGISRGTLYKKARGRS